MSNLEGKNSQGPPVLVAAQPHPSYQADVAPTSPVIAPFDPVNPVNPVKPSTHGLPTSLESCGEVAPSRIASAVILGRAVSTNPIFPSIKLLGQDIVFGRQRHADVRINHVAISKAHCKITREFDKESKQHVWWLTDMSTNGTYVGGKSIGKNNRCRLTHRMEFVLMKTQTPQVNISYLMDLNEKGEVNLDKCSVAGCDSRYVSRRSHQHPIRSKQSEHFEAQRRVEFGMEGAGKLEPELALEALLGLKRGRGGGSSSNSSCRNDTKRRILFKDTGGVKEESEQAGESLKT